MNTKRRLAAILRAWADRIDPQEPPLEILPVEEFLARLRREAEDEREWRRPTRFTRGLRAVK